MLDARVLLVCSVLLLDSLDLGHDVVDGVASYVLVASLLLVVVLFLEDEATGCTLDHITTLDIDKLIRVLSFLWQ